MLSADSSISGVVSDFSPPMHGSFFQTKISSDGLDYPHDKANKICVIFKVVEALAAMNQDFIRLVVAGEESPNFLLSLIMCASQEKEGTMADTAWSILRHMHSAIPDKCTQGMRAIGEKYRLNSPSWDKTVATVVETLSSSPAPSHM